MVPGEGQLQFVKGSMDELKAYKFGSGKFIHRVSGPFLQ